MAITSFSFFAFSALAVAAYYIVPKRYRWCVLLAFSLAYYLLGPVPQTIVYLLITVTSVYLASRYFSAVRASGKAANGEMPASAKIVFILTLLLNIGLLAALKYNAFILYNVNGVISLLGKDEAIPGVDWAASLGISYYTLQMVGYLCDSYWGVRKVQSDPLKLLLFGCYFPQMASGPISRYEQIADSLYEGHSFDYERILFGAQRALWGLFKKLVVAERLSLFVAAVYEVPLNYSAFYIWFATFAFAIQLYTDFSGAMDIIMGVSECFGVVLPENFRAPFFSKTIQEFWQRWHITLGSWLKDYILYPILKSRLFLTLGKWTRKRFGKKAGKKLVTYFGMLFVWLAMGMWHGSGWKYIVGEGIWFWLMLILGDALAPLFQKLTVKCGIKTDCFSWRLFQSLRTFLIFSVGMVFFRAESLPDAVRLIYLSFTMKKITAMRSIIGIGMDGWQWFICLAGMLTVLAVDILREKTSVRKLIAKQNLYFRWLIWMGLIFAVLLYGQYGPGYDAAEFIYQNF